jgi:hypothetical protein
VTAREHAEHASRLLTGAATLEDQLAALSDEDRLQAAIGGGFTRANADLRYTIETATAHALTALALEATGREDEPA